MTAYRLLAMDLDGTAVNDGCAPTEAVRGAVAAAEERGVRVVVATGRPYGSAMEYAAQFGLHNPVICYQGALVKETCGERTTLLAESMPRGPLEDLLALAEGRAWEFNLYSEAAIYAVHARQEPEFYLRWFGLEMQRVPSLAESLRIIDAGGLTPLKALITGEAADDDRLIDELRARYAGGLSIVRSHPLFVEAVSPQASKGRALAALAGHYGIRRDEVLAVGDSGNDLSMVQWAGVGVAMANASPDVLQAADWVAPSVAEDGLAAVVERYILRNGRG